jgi:hypothetical protein
MRCLTPYCHRRGLKICGGYCEKCIVDREAKRDAILNKYREQHWTEREATPAARGRLEMRPAKYYGKP